MFSRRYTFAESNTRFCVVQKETMYARSVIKSNGGVIMAAHSQNYSTVVKFSKQNNNYYVSLKCLRKQLAPLQGGFRFFSFYGKFF